MAVQIYWITAVSPPNASPITKVCAFETSLLSTGKWSLGTIKPYTRQQVVDGLKRKTAELWTCTIDPTTGGWTRGAKVELTKDEVYITTEPNNSTRDNLGSLPACTC